MSIRLNVDDDHEVVGSGYCMGHTDSIGKSSPGFYCPTEDLPSAIYCCDTFGYKYCCTKKDETHASISDLAMTLCIVGGATFVVAVLVCIACICCHVKRQHQKRSATINGPIYRMHCSSTGSGVANMYSFSNQNSSVTTPIDINGPVHHLVELDYHDATGSGCGGGGGGSYEAEDTVKTSHSFAAVDLIPKNAHLVTDNSRREDDPPSYESAVPKLQTETMSIVDIREDPPSSPTPQPSPDIPAGNDEDRLKDNHLSPDSAALMVPGVHTLKMSQLCSPNTLQITGQTNREDSLYWSTKF
ncbi:hypothetical protein CHUAL_004966 [Chamberlinius hualienensis]